MLFLYFTVTHALTLLYILLCMRAAIAFSDVCSLFVVILALRVAWMSHQACCISSALEAEARPPMGCFPLEVRVWVRSLNPSPQVTNSVLPVQNREWEEMVAEGKMFQALQVAVGEQLCVRGVIGKAEMWSRLKIFCCCCPGLTEPRRMTYSFNFSHFTYNSNLSVNLYLSKHRPTFFSLWQHIVLSYFGYWVQAFTTASRD